MRKAPIGGSVTVTFEGSPPDSDELHGRLLTWSGDMRIPLVFSKQQDTEAQAKMGPVLFLCVNVPKSALFSSVGECGQFFDELERYCDTPVRPMHQQLWQTSGLEVLRNRLDMLT
jgi:hypothetical protein